MLTSAKFISFLLVRHPETFKRLREETQSVVGDEVELTRAHIPNLGYLKCVLNESMRWLLIHGKLY